jgi:hypothetical protein
MLSKVYVLAVFSLTQASRSVHCLLINVLKIFLLKDAMEPVAAGAANNVPAPAAAAASALQALLAGGAGNLQALLNLPDADDETMVQLAIALSLQDQV